MKDKIQPNTYKRQHGTILIRCGIYTMLGSNWLARALVHLTNTAAGVSSACHPLSCSHIQCPSVCHHPCCWFSVNRLGLGQPNKMFPSSDTLASFRQTDLLHVIRGMLCPWCVTFVCALSRRPCLVDIANGHLISVEFGA
jgi:hypothetical protein